MSYIILADLVVIIHLLFILFAAFGGFLVLWRKRCVWFHVPAVLWAALIEFAGWVCPLTPLENWFREQGGTAVFEPGFIEHYLLPVIYPAELSRHVQIVLGVLVLGINLAIYWLIWTRSMKTKG